MMERKSAPVQDRPWQRAKNRRMALNYRVNMNGNEKGGYLVV